MNVYGFNDKITFIIFVTCNCIAKFCMVRFCFYIGGDFYRELLVCVCYNGDFVIPVFVISRFCSINLTATLG